jgi:hypothetical protein
MEVRDAQRAFVQRFKRIVGRNCQQGRSWAFCANSLVSVSEGRRWLESTRSFKAERKLPDLDALGLAMLLRGVDDSDCARSYASSEVQSGQLERQHVRRRSSCSMT